MFKKFLLSIVILLVAVVGFSYFLLFTGSGNNLLKPYLSKYASQKSGLNIDIKTLELKPNHLKTTIFINTQNRVDIDGDIDIMKKWFDLDFKAVGEGGALKNEKASINGKAVGVMDDFKVNAKGAIFDASIFADTKVKSFKAKDLKLNVKGLSIQKVLAFVNKPAYATGKVDVDVDVPSLDVEDLSGKAFVNVTEGKLSEPLIKRDFNVTLPKNVVFKAKSSSLLKNAQAVSSVNIISNIATLNTTKSIYNIKDKSIKSDFHLKVPSLSELKPIVKTDLRGSFEAIGDVSKKGDSLVYSVSTSSLGGLAKLDGKNSTLSIDAKSLKIKKIFYMLNLPDYLRGDIFVNGKIVDAGSTKQNGKVVADIKNGKVNKALLYKDMQIKFPSDFSYSDHSVVTLNAQKINFNSLLKSTVLSLKVSDGIYDSLLKSLVAKYHLNIPDLSKTAFLTKRKILGKANFIGDVKMLDGVLTSEGKSDIFGADTKYSYKNGDITVNSTDLDTIKLSKALGYPAVFNSKGKLQAYYSPKWKKGVFSVNFKDGRLLPNELTNVVYALSGFDMTKEIYKDSVAKGSIQNDIVKFAFDMNSTKSMLKVYSAKLNTKTKKIGGKFIVKIGSKDIEGEIRGDIDHPKVKVNSSSYIKNKIEKAIEKKVPKKFQKPLKEILNLFGK